MLQERRNEEDEVRVKPDAKKNRMRSRQLLRDVVSNRVEGEDGRIDLEAIEELYDFDEE